MKKGTITDRGPLSVSMRRLLSLRFVDADMITIPILGFCKVCCREVLQAIGAYGRVSMAGYYK